MMIYFICIWRILKSANQFACSPCIFLRQNDCSSFFLNLGWTVHIIVHIKSSISKIIQRSMLYECTDRWKHALFANEIVYVRNAQTDWYKCCTNTPVFRVDAKVAIVNGISLPLDYMSFGAYFPIYLCQKFKAKKHVVISLSALKRKIFLFLGSKIVGFLSS